MNRKPTESRKKLGRAVLWSLRPRACFLNRRPETIGLGERRRMFQPMSRGHLSELPKEDIAYRQAIPGVVHNQLRQISHEEVEERSSISSRKQDEAHAMNETVLL